MISRMSPESQSNPFSSVGFTVDDIVVVDQVAVVSVVILVVVVVTSCLITLPSALGRQVLKNRGLSPSRSYMLWL